MALTKSDFDILAGTFRKIRPQRPTLDEMFHEGGGILLKEYAEKLREWRFYRNNIMDACVAINWRFNRDLFIEATER